MVVSPVEHLFGQYYFNELFGGIRPILAEQGIVPVLLNPYGNWQMGIASDFAAARHVDGAILTSLHGDEPLPGFLVERGIPVVIQGPKISEDISHVDCDNRAGARSAVEHLLSLGRRRIGTIAGNMDLTGAVGRMHGYRDAVAQAGLDLDPTLVEIGDYSVGRARMAMERLLLNHPDIDGVFTASDEMALSALDVLHTAGKRVPEDVAVVCYDDTESARTANPPLSVIRQPVKEMGREVAKILLREMADANAEPTHLVFTPELIARATTIG